MPRSTTATRATAPSACEGLSDVFKNIDRQPRGNRSPRHVRTPREMGIRTVAVYSEADSQALHVLTADEAVFLGESDPTSSYLNFNKIIAGAHETGAEAIHPGYGLEPRIQHSPNVQPRKVLSSSVPPRGSWQSWAIRLPPGGS